VERARAGGGPTVLQADCYRWRGHNLNDAHHLYRSRDEVDKAKERDPLAVMRSTLAPLASEQELTEIEQRVNNEFEAAIRFAEESAAPDVTLVYEGVPA
jgi:TPP-dependent pyruvate/acetoin dehydrogenase alpha subunit